MRILFDQNVPRNLRAFLAGHEVQTAAGLGWEELENGELLRVAEEARFDLFITGDQSLAYQQNLSGRAIAIIELTKNNWPSIKPQIGRIQEAVSQSKPGTYLIVEAVSQSKPGTYLIVECSAIQKTQAEAT